jgi:hypothetical protein
MTNPVNTNASASQGSAPQASAPKTSSPKISAKEIHVKWDKISEVDASGMRLTSDLVTQVQAKYALSADQAQRDVNAWTNGRSF